MGVFVCIVDVVVVVCECVCVGVGGAGGRYLSKFCSYTKHLHTPPPPISLSFFFLSHSLTCTCLLFAVVCHVSGYALYRCYTPTESRPNASVFGLFCLQNGLLLGDLPAKAYEPHLPKFESRVSFS